MFVTTTGRSTFDSSAIRSSFHFTNHQNAHFYKHKELKCILHLKSSGYFCNGLRHDRGYRYRNDCQGRTFAPLRLRVFPEKNKPNPGNNDCHS